MSRRRAVTKAAIARAVAGARAAGLKVGRVEIADGKIVIHSEGSTSLEPDNPFDAWRAKRDARETKGPQSEA